MGIRTNHEWYTDAAEGGFVCRNCGLVLGQPNRPCVWSVPKREGAMKLANAVEAYEKEQG
jgi:hypothetical protein